MRKKVCICDRCGKEIPDDFNARTELPVWVTDFDGDYRWGVRVDLCESCTKELDNLLRHHFLSTNDGEYTMKDAPYAEIAGLENLVEDQLKEIEELEEELERLRDVKDELFETNFVLTAKLKELGVEVED
jgi:hypothetical protein